MLTQPFALQETQENLKTARQEFLDGKNKSKRKLAAVRMEKIEKDLDAQLAELRRAQDALRKATEARKKVLQLVVESLPARTAIAWGGGTLGISGWGCAARTLEPLAYTRASFSWILLPYTRVNSPNHSYPRVAEYGFSIFSPVSWSRH